MAHWMSWVKEAWSGIAESRAAWFRPRCRPARVALALVLAATWTPATAQEEAPVAGFEGMVEVSEVLLDVLATGRSGQIVTGLGRDDFIVEENGEPVEITGVSFYATRYGTGGTLLTAAGDEAIPSSRYFVFFFHDQTQGGSIANYLSRRQTRAKRESLRWVEEYMLPSDWVAIISYDLRLKLHQDFTQDRAALAEGIKSATSRRDPERNVERHGRRRPPSGAPSLLRHLPQGKALRKQTRNPYDGIRLVAEAAGWIVGRKNLLLFSVGFGELVTGGMVTEADRRYYPRMEHALNDHNVAVYPIDLAPLEVEHFQARFLIELALDTGGACFRNLNSFLPAINRISEDNAGYYLLSYQSEHPADETGYQKVKVRATGDGVKLHARRGYRYGTE